MPFASGIPSPVDLKVGDDGSLYYLARGTGAATGVVYRISYAASTPSITTHPSSQTVAPGASVTFSVRASGPPPLRYQWQRNGVEHLRRDGAGLHDRRQPQPTTARASAPSSATTPATC